MNKEERKVLPKHLRPYERLFTDGVERLSMIELLAVMLKAGNNDMDAIDMSMKLFAEAGDDALQKMFFASPEWFTSHGVSKVKAAQICAMAELSRRYWTTDQSIRQSFDNPSKVATYYIQQMKGLKQEEIRVAFIDKKHCLKSEKIISRGSYDRTIASTQDMFRVALERGACSMIVVHNHPSGNPEPSADDKMTTKRLVEAGKIVGIPLDDHIIIGDNKYYSFKEWGEIGEI